MSRSEFYHLGMVALPPEGESDWLPIRKQRPVVPSVDLGPQHLVYLSVVVSQVKSPEATAPLVITPR